MRAIVHESYGPPDVVRLRDVAVPAPAADEVLVRVRAAALNPYDWHWLTGLPYVGRVQFGLRGPKRVELGADFAGVVESAGPSVSDFRPGDEVFGEVVVGAFADYVCVSPRSIAIKPRDLTMEQAAAVPMGGLTALQGLRDRAALRAGQRVLVNGASGGVGTFAVQIAAALGGEVTGVCSGRNVELVRSLGAERVIDYAVEDFTNSGRYDVILDNVGNRSPSECRRALAATGVYVASYGRPDRRWLGPTAQLFGMFVANVFSGQKLVTFVATADADDLATLGTMIDAGEVVPVIDRIYPLSDAAEALRYLERGHARGKVVLTI